MKKRIITFILLGMFLAARPSLAATLDGESEQTFKQAQTAYLAGDYSSSAAMYESLLGAGTKSANVYYNLGNTYIKKGELGKGILNYERARRITPRDKDLEYNYRYAKNMIKQKDTPEIKNKFFAEAMRFFDRFTLRENMVIGMIIWYFVVFFLVFCLFFHQIRVVFMLVSFVLFVVLGVQILPITKKFDELLNGAIVIAKTTDARFEPKQGAEVHFPLYEGMRVYVLRKEGEWDKVKRPDGKIGWVEAKAIEKIAP